MIADRPMPRIENRLSLARGARVERFSQNAPLPTVRAADGETLRPPLKWAGGKRWLVAQLRAWWHPHRHRRYVEPFCGGLAGALGLNPDGALLNDNNAPLIHFYLALQTGLIASSWVNESEVYYAARNRFNVLVRDQASNQEETQELAHLFYYLNRTCYNGLCRFNRKGEFNVPFGKYKKPRYETDFSPYREVMARWQFMAGDFSHLPLHDGDFIYADPPYDVPFRQYSQFGFGWDDQERLAHWLAAHRGPVVVSNQATERILELYSGLGFAIHIIEAPRRIACNGDRTPAQEMLATRLV